MDENKRRQITSIIDDVDDMTIATVRDDGYPQATTVSYVNEGLTIYFGTAADSQKAKNIAKENKVSLTINRDYADWSEIEGLSIAGLATPVTDPSEQARIGGMMFAKFPQIADYISTETNPDELALFRVDPQIVSLLDYSQGFGHCELIKV